MKNMSTRIRRIAAVAMLATLVTAGLTASANADQIDSSCKRSSVSANDGFNTYWAAEGVGWESWRVALNLTTYDRCDHGGIRGTVQIYDAAVTAKGGQARVARLSYATSTDNRWTTRSVNLFPAGHYGGWQNYTVATDSNIGMTRTTRITSVKQPTYLIFNGVPGASRREQCSMISGTCHGYIGM